MRDVDGNSAAPLMASAPHFEMSLMHIFTALNPGDNSLSGMASTRMALFSFSFLILPQIRSHPKYPWEYLPEIGVVPVPPRVLPPRGARSASVFLLCTFSMDTSVSSS